MSQGNEPKAVKTVVAEQESPAVKLVSSESTELAQLLDVVDEQENVQSSEQGSSDIQRGRLLAKSMKTAPAAAFSLKRWLADGTISNNTKSTPRIAATDYKVSIKNGAPVSKAVFVRYRSFSGIDKWLRDRLAENKVLNYFSETLDRRVALLVMMTMFFVLLPYVLQLAGILGVQVLIRLVELLKGGAATGAMSATVATQISNCAFVVALQAALLGGLGGSVALYVSKATDLALTQEGMRWYWRTNGKFGRLVRWQELNEVRLIHNSKKGSKQGDVIVFYGGGKPQVTLKMSSLDSIGDKELLLAAIESWAPHLRRNAELIQTLQPPADSNYTEVWLTALTAPPKRERLKPLVEGVSLHDDSYKVVRSIGTGGQGFAYLAEHGETGDQVVLKEFILPVFVDVAVRRKALEKFETEARLLKRLDHNQVVKLVDYFVEDHRAYLVLEYIDGVSLRQLVDDEGPLPEKQVLELTKQMAHILEYLHSSSPPIVHRDFTPDNLILRKDGTLKLIDFNVAQQLDSTVVATVVGKHAYLAPEQFQGVPVTQSDIYSMGATMHYLLTGTDPLPISVSTPQKLRPEIDDLLNLVVSKATTRHLNERYGTVRDLIDDLFPLEAIPFRIDPDQ